MKRPVVIIDPISSGVELAPTFKARGVPAVAITLETKDWPEFGAQMQKADFVETIPDSTGIEAIIKRLDPIAIIPGTEEAIPLADRLTERLLPQYANDPQRSLHRGNKYLMQKALEEAGVPALMTYSTNKISEAKEWVAGRRLKSFILKPPASSGSEMVFHIKPGDDWTEKFNQILTEPSVISGKTSETVVIQEQAVGPEYAVGTVSANGNHYLAHLIKYNKIRLNGRETVYDFVEFVPCDEPLMNDLFGYTKQVLNALGVRWGATHTEIICTENGPRLIETSARMIGGPVVHFARAATGSSQADKMVEAYVDSDVTSKEYVFNKTVMPVFLRAATGGIISNLEVFEDALNLPTLLNRYLWVKNGEYVRQTVDYLTAIGIIALSGDRESIFCDYKKIRAMESQLQFD